jgi:hypothetical protein
MLRPGIRADLVQVSGQDMLRNPPPSSSSSSSAFSAPSPGTNVLQGVERLCAKPAPLRFSPPSRKRKRPKKSPVAAESVPLEEPALSDDEDATLPGDSVSPALGGNPAGTAGALPRFRCPLDNCQQSERSWGDKQSLYRHLENCHLQAGEDLPAALLGLLGVPNSCSTDPCLPPMSPAGPRG